jgi:hypothetical protein
VITTFSLDSFRITDTRSLHEDTDFVTVSIKVGAGDPITKTKAVGNVNNGTHPVGLGVSADIPENENVPVICSYLITNNGHGNPSDVQRGAETALSSLGAEATKVATTAAGAAIGAELGATLGTAAVPMVGTAIGALTGWLVGKIGTVLFANCDGVVATGVRVLNSQQLMQDTAGAHVISETTEHPGTDSATGCGANSRYFTTTSISATATAERVTDPARLAVGSPGTVRDHRTSHN